MDWTQVTDLTIPEGNVKQISVNGVVIWKKVLSPNDYTQLEYIQNDSDSLYIKQAYIRRRDNDSIRHN